MRTDNPNMIKPTINALQVEQTVDPARDETVQNASMAPKHEQAIANNVHDIFTTEQEIPVDLDDSATTSSLIMPDHTGSLAIQAQIAATATLNLNINSDHNISVNPGDNSSNPDTQHDLLTNLTNTNPDSSSTNIDASQNMSVDPSSNNMVGDTSNIPVFDNASNVNDMSFGHANTLNIPASDNLPNIQDTPSVDFSASPTDTQINLDGLN